MRFFNAITKISKAAYFVAFMTFLMRAGQFMSLPFLAIYLTREGLFTAGQIGIILGISGFVLSITGLINGIYVDRNSHRNALIVALFLSGFCYFGFAFSTHVFYGLLLLNAALGWFRSLIEISVVTMLVQHTKPENLSYAHSARFIGANLGVVLGPLIGGIMATQQSLLIFFIAGAIHIGLGVTMCFYREMPKTAEAYQSKAPAWGHFREIFKEKILINIMIINLILWTVYAQLDTTIPQYLARTGENPAVLFSTMMVINALICIIFQPFILRWAELTSLRISAIIGCSMFTIAFLLISICPTPIGMIISVAIMRDRK
ncbi:MAG: MFS transporter, partial [Gammaproteobacteria bacterium]